MYDAEGAEGLQSSRFLTVNDLFDVTVKCLKEKDALTDPKAREHLQYGVGRRLGVMRRAIGRIFDLFPPNASRPLSDDALMDVQAHLQAFVINVSGVFDNFAWAFLFRHGLQAEVGKLEVGLFKEKTQRYLPKALRAYVTKPELTSWHANYLKGFRDSLAHRIPLYVPPCFVAEEDAERYRRLSEEESSCIVSRDESRLEKVRADRSLLERPCFFFLHEFSADERAKPLLLHPQLIADSATVIDCGKAFFAAWHDFTPQV